MNSSFKFHSGPEEDPFKQETYFEVHRLSERAPARSLLMLPFSKPAPSKWDNADKWIASPTSSHTGKGVGGGKLKKSGLGGNENRQMGTKVVFELMDEPDTNRIGRNQVQMGTGGQRDLNLVVDLSARPDSVLEKSVADTPTSLSRHDLPSSVQCSATVLVSPPTAIKSGSKRDIGTEMTPLASHEPSRTGTPVRVASPTHSPTFSRPLSPIETEENSTVIVSDDLTADSEKKLYEEELRMETRREIMSLGQQLGKMNLAAWASKEEEEEANASPLKAVSVDQPASNTAARAAAWGETEKAKYLARFKQEEVKIQAWENHQKAKTEAEMRKFEVGVERMRARANDKLMNKLGSAKHKAEEKRAAAEARKNCQAAKTAEQVEYIRRTGSVPSSSSSSCWSWFLLMKQW